MLGIKRSTAGTNVCNVDFEYSLSQHFGPITSHLSLALSGLLFIFYLREHGRISI